MQLLGIFMEEVHVGPAGEQWGLNWSIKTFPNFAPIFLPKNPPASLDEKLKVDLFKACLSDTFLGFITFL